MSRKPFSRISLITLAALCLSSTGVLAGKPHVHGIATLNLSLSDTEVEVTLDSPADNLVGFEHQPRNDKQRAAAEQAVKRLQNASSLIRFTADGGCELKEADIDSPFDTEHDHDDDHHHGKKHDHDHDDDHHHGKKHDHDHDDDHHHGKKHDHDHDDDHHHGKKHDHDHDDDHHHGKKHDHDHDDDHHHGEKHDHDHDGDAHSDFEVEYEFHCKNTAAVQSVDLKGFFTHFHNFQTINVNWAGKHGQSSARATLENPVVKLKK